MKVRDVPMHALFMSANDDGMVWQRVPDEDPKVKEAISEMHISEMHTSDQPIMAWARIVNKEKYPNLVHDTFYWHPDKLVKVCSMSNAMNRLETE